MNEPPPLLNLFEADRARLRGVAYRLLGSASDAEDAVQEAWLRVASAEASDIANLHGWLTTIVSRIAIDMLRARRTRREDAKSEDPAERPDQRAGPEAELMLAETVGIALLVVLDRLRPAERVAFVLHDSFGMAFRDVARVLDCSPEAARQLASRARRAVRGARPEATEGSVRRGRVVRAFFAASRGGDMAALLALLDPDAVLALETGEVRGAEAAAARARVGAGRQSAAQVMLVDRAPGIVVAPMGRVRLAMTFTVAGERIVRIGIVSEAAGLAALDIAILSEA